VGGAAGGEVVLPRFGDSVGEFVDRVGRQPLGQPGQIVID